MRKLRKMKNLVKRSANLNKEKFMEEMKVHQEEEVLKKRAKKSKKYERKLNQFLKTKEQKLKKIYNKFEKQINLTLNAVVDNKTNKNDQEQVERNNKGYDDGELPLISDTRLKTYD